MKAEHFDNPNGGWEGLKVQILKHQGKSDFVPVDASGLSADQVVIIRKSVFIVGG